MQNRKINHMVGLMNNTDMKNEDKMQAHHGKFLQTVFFYKEEFPDIYEILILELFPYEARLM